MPRIFRASVYSNSKSEWPLGLYSEVYDDETFELVPIQDKDQEDGVEPRTYDQVPSWHDPKQSLAKYLRMPRNLTQMSCHDDPDLHTHMAYGEAYTARGSALFDMDKGDYLLFIAHLCYADSPGNPIPKHPRSGWYLVGCLKVSYIEEAGGGKSYSKKVSHHAHYRLDRHHDFSQWDGVVNTILCGDSSRKDQRFSRAVPILTAEQCRRLVRDKNRKVVDPEQPTRNGNMLTVKSCVGSYTRTGQCIGDTEDKADDKYLSTLRKEILERNPGLQDLLW